MRTQLDLKNYYSLSNVVYFENHIEELYRSYLSG